jgi:hypothetical protein
MRDELHRDMFRYAREDAACGGYFLDVCPDPDEFFAVSCETVFGGFKHGNMPDLIDVTYRGLDPAVDIYKNIELYHGQNEEMGKPSYSIRVAEEYTRKLISGI